MPSVLKIFGWPWIPPGKTKAAEGGIRPKQCIKDRPTLTFKTDELAEERAKVTRLDQKYRRAKAKADELAGLNRRLENKLREVKERLQAREKELADKNASLEQLEKSASEAQAKRFSKQRLRPTVSCIQEPIALPEEKDKLPEERATELNAVQTRTDPVLKTEVVENPDTLISSTSGGIQDALDQQEPPLRPFVEQLDSDHIYDVLGSPIFTQSAIGDPFAVNFEGSSPWLPSWGGSWMESSVELDTAVGPLIIPDVSPPFFFPSYFPTIGEIDEGGTPLSSDPPFWSPTLPRCICGCGGGPCIHQRPYRRPKGDPLANDRLGELITFRVHEQCGIPLMNALRGTYSGLSGRDDPMFVGSRTSVSIRLEWPGCPSWAQQMRTKDWRRKPSPITKAKLATEVAKKVDRFLKDMRRNPRSSELGPSAPSLVDTSRLTLVALEHVSLASWQPHLRLT